MDDECQTCNIPAWEHCGHCLCCPDLPQATYEVAATMGVTPSDLARAIYEGSNAGVSADEAINAALSDGSYTARIPRGGNEWPVTPELREVFAPTLDPVEE